MENQAVLSLMCEKERCDYLVVVLENYFPYQ